MKTTKKNIFPFSSKQSIEYEIGVVFLFLVLDFEMRWTEPRKQKALESYHRTGVIPDGFTPEEIRDLDCRYSVFGLQGLKQTKLQRKM